MIWYDMIWYDIWYDDDLIFDIWYLIRCDTIWYLIFDIWYMIFDMIWYMIYDIWYDLISDIMIFDFWYWIYDIWYLIWNDIWYMIYDIWYMIYDMIWYDMIYNMQYYLPILCEGQAWGQAVGPSQKACLFQCLSPWLFSTRPCQHRFVNYSTVFSLCVPFCWNPWCPKPLLLLYS